ncbi:hypothetical protein [Anaeroselena agilis]|uniref:Uncharacterized protein n=1 Tax=Anaeroselena agilis TaxID=3063788 RepID=A0ABU3P421_9FIRM|nr:hypothetical protein [Selenomonadales bacterium 4137-cl]
MAAIKARHFFVIAAAASIIVAGWSGIAAAANASVEAVTVSVRAGDAPPPSRVIKRMEQSIATVGDHVLAGRKVADVESGKASYEKLIKEIFDRVLVGYSVQEVNITPGTTAHIAVRILPWGDIVRKVALETDLGGISPQLEELFRSDLGNIEDKIGQVLIGMPVDSVDWAGSVSKSVIREYLAAQLPEFRANIEIIAGQTTTVRLSLAPAGPLIKDVRVTLRSRTIPNFLLLEARPGVEDAASPLRGLPVAFVERHGDYFKDMLMRVASAQPVVGRYSLTLTSALRPGVTTDMDLSAETTKYNVKLEGYLDMGRKENDTSARLHVGQYLGRQDELFMEVTFIPASVTWEFVPGWGHRLGPATEAGVKYNLSSKQGLFWLKQDLDERWSLRLERTPITGVNEAGLRYKLHEFLSAEYVITNNNRWLRLVGNL